jgi:hypothetical protein
MSDIFSLIREDTMAKADFSHGVEDLRAGEQLVTVTKATLITASLKGSVDKEEGYYDTRIIFSLRTKEGVILDKGLVIPFNSQSASTHARRLIGSVGLGCGLTLTDMNLDAFAGCPLKVKLGQKKSEKGFAFWCAYNWGYMKDDGSFHWMYNAEREEQELNGSKTAKSSKADVNRVNAMASRNNSAKAEAPKAEAPKAEAPKAGETGSLPDMAMDFISGLDDPLGGPVS